MALYAYSNPDNPDEYVEIVQGMNEPHVYVKDGVSWVREFYSPNAAIDTQIDPLSPKDFTNKTANKKGRLGDMFDRSKEMSIKREKIMGRDEVKEQYKKNWSAKRAGRAYPKFLEGK